MIVRVTFLVFADSSDSSDSDIDIPEPDEDGKPVATVREGADDVRSPSFPSHPDAIAVVHDVADSDCRTTTRKRRKGPTLTPR